MEGVGRGPLIGHFRYIKIKLDTKTRHHAEFNISKVAY